MGSGGRRVLSFGQQVCQTAVAVMSDQILPAADMIVADEYLWRRRDAPEQEEHFIGQGLALIDAQFLDVRDAALIEQLLGVKAVGA